MGRQEYSIDPELSEEEWRRIAEDNDLTMEDDRLDLDEYEDDDESRPAVE